MSETSSSPSTTQTGQNFDQQLQALLQIWSSLSAPGVILPPEGLQELQGRLQERLARGESGQQSQDVYQVLVEHSLQGFAIVQDFNIVYANHALTQITGYYLDEMRTFCNEIITSIFRTADLPGIWVRLVSYLADGVLSPRLELCFPHKDGTARWAETHANSVMHRGKPTILITCVDITERKQAELELHQMYAALELRVRERAEALATANGALQAEIVERRQAERALQQAHAELEIRVQQRTEELAKLNLALQHEMVEREQAEEALRHSEELFRSLSENASDIITVIARDGTFRYGSPSISRLLGYKPEELIGRSIFDYIHPDDLEHVTEILQEALSAPAGSMRSVEFRFRHQNGSWRILESIGENLVGNPVTDGLVVNSRDISQRKRIEEEKARLLEKVQQQHEQLRALALRRRRLAQQVVMAHEEERYRVSRELHDEAGQALTALKIGLEDILFRLPPANEDTGTAGQLRLGLSKALALCESTSSQIRSLAHDLRPAALEDLGLDLALEGFCRDFAERTNLSISYTGEDIPGLSDAAGICLYRILQEGLTNVARHAQAHQVHVTLCDEPDRIVLCIKDNGQGFEIRPELSHASPLQGIGLLGMQERLESLGGQLEIESSPGHGTQL